MGIGSGISFSIAGVRQALSNLKVNAVGEAVNTLKSATGPWRPPGWAQGAAVTIRVPGDPKQAYSPASLGITNGGVQPLATQAGSIDGLEILATTGTALRPGQTGSPDTLYVFDAILQSEHAQEMQLTEHPVQSGSNILQVDCSGLNVVPDPNERRGHRIRGHVSPDRLRVIWAAQKTPSNPHRISLLESVSLVTT